MASETINITCSTDKNFIQHCAVLLQSIVANDRKSKFRFFILTDSEANKTEKFISFLDGLKQEYHFVIIDKAAVESFPMHSTHLSKATYNRIFLAKKLGPEIKKIIYLDSDIVINGSLVEMWNIDVSDYYLGAVYNPTWWKLSEKHMKNHLGIQDGRYFNTGVLLINLEKWRQSDISTKLVNFLNEHGQNNVTHDQDTLNAVVTGNWLTIHPKYNLMNAFYDGVNNDKKYSYYKQYSGKELDEAIKNPIVIHYTFRKPWRFVSKHPLKGEYWKYLKMTPWRDYKPEDATVFNCLLKSLLPEEFVIQLGMYLRKRLPSSLRGRIKKLLLVKKK